jgi:nucleotide-binding universal stress UspA family protein
MTTLPVTTARREEAARRRSPFARIVVGVDGTEAGVEACRQAARLVEPDGWLELVAAVNFGEAALTGWFAPRAADNLQRDADNALAAARAVAGKRATERLLNGPATRSLLQAIEDEGATLVALGTHGHSRASEIVLGGCSGELLHSAPCAVLIARPPIAEGLFPRALVVGIDGSREGDEAYLVAQQLGHRFEIPLRTVTALGGKGVDLPAAHLRTPFVEAIDDEPVPALVRASENADLLVVGSRGRHGIRALGSVSERVAHRARCSVLVVRPDG